jgi:hypothetical protein
MTTKPIVISHCVEAAAHGMRSKGNLEAQPDI